MSFVYNRRSLYDNIDDMCFFTPEESQGGTCLPYTIIFNTSIIKIYSPKYKILEKDLFRPIKQIVNAGNRLFILFTDGNISEAEYGGGRLRLVSLMYIDEAGENSFIRQDKNILYVQYNHYKFGIWQISEAKKFDLNKPKIFEKHALQGTKQLKTGLHALLDISESLNNVKDVALVDDFIYFLYSPDLKNMCVLIVDLYTFRVIREIAVERTAFKFFRMNDTRVLVLSSTVLYFLWSDFTVFVYRIPFCRLFDLSGEGDAKDDGGIIFSLFNTAEVFINNFLYIFNGDDKIYRLKINYVGSHIQSITTLTQSQFYKQQSIRQIRAKNDFIFMILQNRTSLLFQPEISHETKVKKNIKLSEIDDTTDLYNTHVQLEDEPEVKETTAFVRTHNLLKAYHSFGDIRYVFESVTNGNKELFIVAERLIRHYERITFKFKRVRKIGKFRKLFKAKDLFVLTNETGSAFFRWVNDEFVTYSGLLKSNAEEKKVEKISRDYAAISEKNVNSENLPKDFPAISEKNVNSASIPKDYAAISEKNMNSKQALENGSRDIIEQESAYVTIEETLALFYADTTLIQITTSLINVINQRKIPIEAEKALHNEKYIFLKKEKTLKIYEIASLLNGIPDYKFVMEHVESFYVNKSMALVCCSHEEFSDIKLYFEGELIFANKIGDFLEVLGNEHSYEKKFDEKKEMGPENGLEVKSNDNISEKGGVESTFNDKTENEFYESKFNENKYGKSEEGAVEKQSRNCFLFQIDECLVYGDDERAFLVLKHEQIVTIYEGFFGPSKSLPYFIKRKQLISPQKNSLFFVRDFVFVKNHVMVLTSDCSQQKVTNSFDDIFEDNGVVYGISKRRIVEFKLESNSRNYLYKTHNIKNIDKIVRDDENEIYIFTFDPKICKNEVGKINEETGEIDENFFNERQEIVMSTLGFSKLSVFKLPKNELVTDLKVMNLSDSNDDFNNFVVVTLSQRASNEILRGRILVFEVINVISDVAGKKTEKALKILCSERTKGPISCCGAVRGKIAVSLSTKLMVYEFNRNHGIVAIAFLDLYMYAVSLAVIKNYIVVGDIMMGLHFVFFQSEPVKLHLLAKSDKIPNLRSLDFFNSGTSLFICGIDLIGALNIFSFSPKNLFSNDGNKLIKRQRFDTFLELLSVKTALSHNYTSFFSERCFLVALSYTQKNYEKIYNILRKYKEVKNLLGVNLKYEYREVCFKKYIFTNLLLAVFNEPIRYQKRLCEETGCLYEDWLRLVEDFL